MLGRRYLILFAIGLLLQSGLVAAKNQAKTEKNKSEKKIPTIESIRQAVDQSPRDVDVKLFDIVGDFLMKIPIPEPAKRLFNKDIMMRNLRVVKELPRSPYIRSGIGFSGSMFFNNAPITVTMYVLRDRTLMQQYMIVVEMQKNFKISDMFPPLNALDIFSFPKQTLVLSTFDFYGPEGGLLKPGLYFDALLDLSGPLDALRAMKATARQFDSIIFEEEPIHFWGKIPVGLSYKGGVTKAKISVVFGSEIPIRVGIDFRNLRQLPRSITNTFQKLTTDNFNIKVAVHPKLAITLETGVRLTLGTQRDPLRLTGVGVIVPGKKTFALGARLRGMLELNWLALGNVAFQVDFPGMGGLPISGLGYFGQIDVGRQGKSRATFKVAGKTVIRKDKDGDIQLPGDVEADDADDVPGDEAIGIVSPLGVFAEVSAENVQIHHVVELLAQMGRKARVLKSPFPTNKIPIMQINKLRGYAAIDSVTIANKFYKAGFRLYLDTHFFNQKVLFDVEIFHRELKMSGVGYLSDIKLDLNGKPIFSLTGPGLDQKYGTKDDGPVLFCSLDVKYPGATLFGLRGELTIPPLGLKAKTDVVFHGTNFKADVEGEYPGFTGLFSVYINPLNIKDMYIKLGFKRNFENFLGNQAKQILQELKTNASQRLEELNQTIGDLSKGIQDVGKKTGQVLDKEVKATKVAITRINKKIQKLNESCDKANPAQKKKVCKKVGIKVATKKMALKAQELYLERLLKPGKKTVVGASQIVENVTKELRRLELLKKGVEVTVNGLSNALDGISQGKTIFRVKEVVGSYSAKEMSEGKLPILERFVVQTNIPGIPTKTITLHNVQFDFKDASQSAMQLVRTIMRTLHLIE